MVIPNVESWPAGDGWLLAEAAAPDSLPPATRAAALMALVVIGLIGLLIIAAILVGGHWVRRQGDSRRGPSVPRDRAPLASSSARAHTAESEDASRPCADDTPPDDDEAYGQTRPD